jgi:hypothetical protein
MTRARSPFRAIDLVKAVDQRAARKGTAQARLKGQNRSKPCLLHVGRRGASGRSSLNSGTGTKEEGNNNSATTTEVQMSNIEDDQRARMRGRARDAEQAWRDERGLTKGLHRLGNAKRRERRRRAECPKEPKANVRYRRWRDSLLGEITTCAKPVKINQKED